MITSTSLQSIGYTRRESYIIMRRLKERKMRYQAGENIQQLSI